MSHPSIRVAMTLWLELKRRGVLKVTTIYLVAAWLAVQVAATTFPVLLLPDWTVRLVVALALLGLPCVIVLAWMFDVSRSEGITRTANSTTRAGTRPWLRLVAIVGLMLGISAGGYAFATTGNADLDKRRVFVAAFENRTGRSDLAPVGLMAQDWITQGLFHGELGEVVDQNTAALLSKQGDTSDLDAATVAYHSAVASGAGLLITGSYYLQGDSLQIRAQLIEAASRKIVRALEPVAGPASAPMAAVQLLKQRVVAAVAAQLDRNTGTALLSTPPNFEAYQEYMLGREAEVSSDFDRAVTHYRRAVELDSTFIAAHIEIVQMMHNGGVSMDWQRGDSLAAALLANVERLMPAERYRLDRLRARFHGDLEGAYRASKKASPTAPAASQLGLDAFRTRRYREAIAVIRTIEPEARTAYDWGRHWGPFIHSYHMLGQHRRELRAARMSKAFYPQEPRPVIAEIDALAALGRETEVRTAIDFVLTLPRRAGPQAGRDPWVAAAREFGVHGYREMSIRTAEAGLAWIDARPPAERDSPRVRSVRSLLLTHLGKHQEARVAIGAVLTAVAGDPLDPLGVAGQRPILIGQLQIRLGQRDSAELLIARLDSVQDGDVRRRASENFWTAVLSAELGRPDEAVRRLRLAEQSGAFIGQFTHSQSAFDNMRDYQPFRELIKEKE